MIARQPWRRWLRHALAFLSLAVSFALLNRLAAAFEVVPGVSFFFPAAAATAIGAAWLGPWAAFAVWVGNFFFPWGAAVGLVRTGLFGLPEVFYCLVFASALRRAEGRVRRKLSYVLVRGLLLGTWVSATLGAVLLWFFPAPAREAMAYRPLLGFFSWWFSDFAAACTLGLAGVVLVRPQALLSQSEEAVFRRWLRQPSWVLTVIFMALTAALVVGVVSAGLEGKPHWFALLFLPALANAAFRGGTGAALAANGLVAAGYLTLVVAFDATRVQAVTSELVSAYASLLLFTALSWLLGSQAAANRKLLETVERQAAALEAAVDQVAALLAQSLEAKERFNRGHAQRVAALAVKVGENLGLSPQELKVLYRAALLHDAGKVAVAEVVLNQPEELPQDAKALLRRQLSQAVAGLRRVELLKEVMAIVEAVGERWDGNTQGEFAGRLGLVGEQIPLASRIIAPVCAYDAMVHAKPWRTPRTREEAVAELWRCSGSQFDPRVVQALTEILRERWDLEAEQLAV